MREQDIKEGGGDIPLVIMLCKRCDTIFERDGRMQKICRPCQTIGREKSNRKRNKNYYYLQYNKNTITKLIPSALD